MRERFMSWPKRDLFAITADGVILVNIRALDEDNPPPLGLQKGIFVGVALTRRETKLLSEEVYDAMAAFAASRAGRRRLRGGSRK
jgi:hypothetical protein